MSLSFRSRFYSSANKFIIKFHGSVKLIALSALVLTGTVQAERNAKEGTSMNNLPTASMQLYGTLADKTPVYTVKLKNSHGVEIDVISYGGIITRMLTPDANGKLGNIVHGFDKKVWDMAPFTTANSAGVVLSLISPDGDQGYPGKLVTEVTYTLTNDNTLDMAFTATTNKPTIVNLTQHTYFNLAGKGDILDHELMIPSEAITPVDSGLIPTGEVAKVAGTPFDFRKAKAIGKDINVKNQQLTYGKGYDHNFILKDQPSNALIEAASVYEPTTGRTLVVKTVEPAVQFYSGNFLDGATSGQGTVHEHRSAFCLEPQHNPDSPNQPDFASTTLLPGEVYSTRIIYEFGTR